MIKNRHWLTRHPTLATLAIFILGYGLIVTLAYPFWSSAYPVFDEILPLLVSSHFDLKFWFLQSYSDFYTLYPEWSKTQHNVLRPAAHVWFWLLTQFAGGDVTAPGAYRLMLLGSYAWQAGCAGLVFYVAYRLCRRSLLVSMGLSGVMLFSPAVTSFPVNQLAAFSLDIIAAGLVGLCLIAVAHRRAFLAGLWALLAVLTKTNALPPVLLLACITLVDPMRRRIGLWVLLAPVIWGLTRLVAFGSLIGGGPQSGRFRPFNWEIILHYPFDVLVTNHFLDGLVMAIFICTNIAVWICTVTLLAGHIRSIRQNTRQWLHSRMMNRDPGEFVTMTAGLLSLGIIPYILFIDMTIDYRIRFGAIPTLLILFWASGLRIASTVSHVVIAMLLIGSMIFAVIQYRTDFWTAQARFLSDRGRALDALIRRIDREKPGRQIYLANDVALLGVSNSYLERWTGAASIIRLSGVLMPFKHRDKEGAYSPVLKKQPDRWIFTAHLTGGNKFTLSGTSIDKILETRDKGSNCFVRNAYYRYCFNNFRYVSENDYSFGDQIQIEILHPPDNTVLIAYDFKQSRYVVLG